MHLNSFPERKKWMIAMTMSLFTLMSALASSMVAPAALQIAEDLDITATVEVSMTLSIYVLAYGEEYVTMTIIASSNRRFLS